MRRLPVILCALIACYPVRPCPTPDTLPDASVRPGHLADTYPSTEPDAPEAPPMASPQLAPIGITTQTGFSGDIDDINDDPYDPDGSWMEATAFITELQVSFPLPGGDIKTATGWQKFVAWVRRDGTGGSNPSIQMCARDVAGPVTACGSFHVISSTTGQLIEYEWSGSAVAIDGTGADIELLLQQLSGSAKIDVGAVAWIADTDQSSPGLSYDLVAPGGTFNLVSQ